MDIFKRIKESVTSTENSINKLFGFYNESDDIFDTNNNELLIQKIIDNQSEESLQDSTSCLLNDENLNERNNSKSDLLDLEVDKIISEFNKEEDMLFNFLDDDDINYCHSISFSGGGYNCVYHLGVVKYIFRHRLLFRDCIYLGASGGAGIVGLTLCYIEDDDRLEIIDEIIEKIISIGEDNLKPYEQVDKYISILTSYITEERFYKYIKGTRKCHISLTDVTNLFPKNRLKSNYKDYDEFIQTLKATACVPLLLDDRVRKLQDRYYLDGGFSNNIPVISKGTIRISCLNYPLLKADLYPKMLSDLKYCFIPPSRDYVLNLYNLGYGNMFSYMEGKRDKMGKFLADFKLKEKITDIINDDFV